MATIYINYSATLSPIDSSSPLIIFQRTERSYNRSIIILVHGLGGASFGARSTWGNLPSFLIEDLPGWDIGFYSYRTLLGRFRFWKSYPLTDEAEILGDELSELQYDNIVLVGHSLGGVLIRLAAHGLNNRRKDSVLERLVSIILMASPTFGSRAAPKVIAPLARLFSHDFWALHTDNQASHQIENLFSPGVISPIFENLFSRNHIPLWSLVAAEDFWVTKMSASATVPVPQRRTFRSAHTEIVKPKTKHAEPYKWFVNIIQKIELQSNPTIRMRRTTKGLEIRPASSDDLVEVCGLGARELGTSMTPSDLAPFLEVEPFCIWVLRELKTSVLVGYWSVIPLKQQAADKFTSQNARPSALEIDDLAGPRDTVVALYVGAVIGTTHRAKGLALDGLQKSLKSAGRGKDIRIIARAATSDGLNLIHQNNLVPIARDAIDQLFVGIARRRQRRLTP